MTPRDIERFWSYVDRSGGPEACWPWRAGTSTGGYGRFYLAGKTWTAHRVAWILIYGPIPDGQNVLHTCDVRHCCNMLRHGFTGTPADNSHDMVCKGRQATGDRNGSRRHPERRPRGEANPKAKLTADDIREIRRLAAEGVSQPVIARRFGVSQGGTISPILLGRTWRHVPDVPIEEVR
jgi:hypothetical protein